MVRPTVYITQLSRADLILTVEIAREDANDLISERDLDLTMRELEEEATRAIGDDFEKLWEQAHQA
jgi:hypothetical protein